MEENTERVAAAKTAPEPEPAKPAASGRMKWSEVLKAHTGWMALVKDADVSYGRNRVTVSGVAPSQRNRIASCAVLALDPHGYDAYREFDPDEPTTMRIMVKDG